MFSIILKFSGDSIVAFTMRLKILRECTKLYVNILSKYDILYM